MIESWKQSVLVAVVVIAAVAAGAGLQAWSLDHSPAVTDGASAATVAMPCPVAKDICALAANVEKDLQSQDYAKVTSVANLQDNLQAAMVVLLGDARPRLVSIGCPSGANSSTCEGSFALVFTSLQPLDDWTGTTGILLLLYDRTTAGTAVPATLGEVDGLIPRDARRAALAGGIVPSPCNLIGTAPDQSATGCSRSEFLPYGTLGPFIPAEVSVQQPFAVLSPDPPYPDSLMYVATGCWACEGFDTAIQRVFTNPNGVVSVELVSDPPLLPGEIVTGDNATPDGTMLVASTCQATSCGPVGPRSADAHSRVFVSRDGGFSWQELASYPGYLAVRQVTADGRILISRNFGTGDPSTWPLSWELLPARTQLVPPSDVATPAYPVLINGDVAWIPDDPGLSSTAKILGNKLPLTAGDQLVGVLPLANGGVVLSWHTNASGPGAGSRFFVGLLSPKGDLQWKREVPADGQFSPRAQLADTLLIGNVPSPDGPVSGQLPAVIDIDTAAIQPIGLPFGQKPFLGRNTFLAFVPGPFVRVRRLGGCADVRQSPANAAKSFGCFKDGVFLQDVGDVITADGTAWVHVFTPAGEEGWIDSTFLRQ